ncbi:IS3 family transposase [Francisella halioticida]|uniref:IS3 family transposase n=1 Tax=Francisella halioticida TaxID=549298 RepID=UPI001BB3F998
MPVRKNRTTILSIFEYIEAYYNTKRRHSTINYMTPYQFEYIMENEVVNCPKLTG